jgi:hypothetical protein
MTLKHNVSETGSVSVFKGGRGEERKTLLGPLERANSNTGPSIKSINAVILEVVTVWSYRLQRQNNSASWPHSVFMDFVYFSV